MVKGCLDWHEHGLRPPAVIREATDAYSRDEEVVGRWMSEKVAQKKDEWASFGDLYDSFKRWCEARGEFAISTKMFSARLAAPGLESKSSNVVTWVHGLKLLVFGDAASENVPF